MPAESSFNIFEKGLVGGTWYNCTSRLETPLWVSALEVAKSNLHECHFVTESRYAIPCSFLDEKSATTSTLPTIFNRS